MSAQRSAIGYFVTAVLAVSACAIAIWASGEPVRSVGFGILGASAILCLVGTSFLSAKSADGWSRMFVLALTLTGALVVALLLAVGFAAVECQSYDNCLFN